MAGPEGQRVNHDKQRGGVVTVGENALEQSVRTLEELGTAPTAKKLNAILSQEGTGGTGVMETVGSPEKTANITTWVEVVDGELPAKDERP